MGLNRAAQVWITARLSHSIFETPHNRTASHFK
jgi:hypothetical protein